jgi:hypothetical protein
MMGIAPSPTIHLKITDANTSGGSDTAASTDRFTAFSSFLGSIQASPTIGTKSAVKALSSALARSPTAMIKVPQFCFCHTVDCDIFFAGSWQTWQHKRRFQTQHSSISRKNGYHSAPP